MAKFNFPKKNSAGGRLKCPLFCPPRGFLWTLEGGDHSYATGDVGDIVVRLLRRYTDEKTSTVSGFRFDFFENRLERFLGDGG